MSHSPYDLMQMAVDIVQSSPHPTNKIAAAISGVAPDGTPFALARTNFWPESIAQKIGTGTKIGNSSGTVHAETACIMAAPKTKGAKIFITDPPCPNCVKNIAEAGIKEIYIDHKGFYKDWARRNGDTFENMALRICEKSGIAVYEIQRKEQRIEEILPRFPAYTPLVEKPALTRDCEEAQPTRQTLESFWMDSLKRAMTKYKNEPFALALSKNQDGACIMISAEPHFIIGYTSDNPKQPDDKYSYTLQPINRLLMTAARKGLKIDPTYIYSSRTPTSRELVNMLGAGFNEITIGDKEKSRDKHGPRALQQLIDAGVLRLT